MGLVKALDYYRSPRSRFGKEVEYQLYSWGEIGPPFLSLVTRRRVFSTKIIRSDGLPIEQDVDPYQRFHFQERQRSKVVGRQEIYRLLDSLQDVGGQGRFGEGSKPDMSLSYLT